ncbi:MAG: prepilin-type N-terminal cleavage/methylation domain-containing protein [Candidatus Omnitrophica bacterium]|nr:prepilin-type N-terminal cleavage/methylation domain-containing protein [Candidatus Omnitrophota bacterium]
MRKSKGFTLLELIIVIIVIGILVAIALPQFVRVAERGRIAKAKTVLDAFRKAEGIYHALHSTYTTDETALDDEIPEIANVDDSDWSYSVSQAGATTFTVEAQRLKGAHIGNVVKIDNTGNIWEYTP